MFVNRAAKSGRAADGATAAPAGVGHEPAAAQDDAAAAPSGSRVVEPEGTSNSASSSKSTAWPVLRSKPTCSHSSAERASLATGSCVLACKYHRSNREPLHAA